VHRNSSTILVVTGSNVFAKNTDVYPAARLSLRLAETVPGYHGRLGRTLNLKRAARIQVVSDAHDNLFCQSSHHVIISLHTLCIHTHARTHVLLYYYIFFHFTLSGRSSDHRSDYYITSRINSKCFFHFFFLAFPSSINHQTGNTVSRFGIQVFQARKLIFEKKKTHVFRCVWRVP
jgi:hypothetical protein